MKEQCERRYGASNCKVAAGEFIDDDRVFKRVSDSGSMNDCKDPPSSRDCRSYFARYVGALYGRRSVSDAFDHRRWVHPRVWAWHAYAAGTEVQEDLNAPVRGRISAVLRTLLDRTRPKSGVRPNSNVWLSEQGGRAHTRPTEAVRAALPPGSDRRYKGLAEADKDLEFILRLPSISSRISRFYLYEWAGARGATRLHDSGLVDFTRTTSGPDDGPTRSMYCRYRAKTVSGSNCTPQVPNSAPYAP